MSVSWTALRIAQAIGVSGSAWLAGNIACASLIAMPSITESHSRGDISAVRLARQWSVMYNAGKTQNPPIAAAVASSFAYLAFINRAKWSMARGAIANSPQLYGLAAILTLITVPFTLVLIMPTNNKLLEKAKQPLEAQDTKASYDKEFVELIEKWKTLNIARSFLPLFACVVSLVAVLA